MLLEIIGAVSSFGRYRPYWASIVGACYVARTLMYAGLLSVRRPGTCILGRGTDRIYPLGRLPTRVQIDGRQRKREGLYEDGIGRRIQAEADTRQRTTTTTRMRRIRDGRKRRRMAADKRRR